MYLRFICRFSLLLLTLSCRPALPAQAAAPESFAPLAKKVSPAVVNISTTKAVTQRIPVWSPFTGPSVRDRTEKRNNSLGSGFVISIDGYIVTNHHVVAEADEISVTFVDGREVEARIVGMDPYIDLALLKLSKGSDYSFVELGDSDALEVGDWVVAIGNPFGLDHTVTAGIVSAKSRSIGAGAYDDFIQTDASINPGNSGGPLFNIRGEVIGINTAIFANGQGLGFAIPVNMAKDVLPQLKGKGRVDRAWLGISIRELSQKEAAQLNRSPREGLVIGEVVPGSPADEASLKAGDVIIEFNGEKINSQQSFPARVARLAPGSETKIIVLRHGGPLTLAVRLGVIQEKSSSTPTSTKSQELGLATRDLTTDERTLVSNGILVLQVKPGSLADTLNLQAGDILTELNGQMLTSSAVFVQAFRKIPSGSSVKLKVLRGPYETTMNFTKP
jgi:serine protease Do